jgi:hypothetical protein
MSKAPKLGYKVTHITSLRDVDWSMFPTGSKFEATIYTTYTPSGFTVEGKILQESAVEGARRDNDIFLCQNWEDNDNYPLDESAFESLGYSCAYYVESGSNSDLNYYGVILHSLEAVEAVTPEEISVDISLD